MLLLAIAQAQNIVLDQGGIAELGQMFLGSLIDRLIGSNGPSAKPRCTPYPLPAGYTSYQDLCKTLSLANDDYWNEVYKNASGPARSDARIPMDGCVLGCM